VSPFASCGRRRSTRESEDPRTRLTGSTLSVRPFDRCSFPNNVLVRRLLWTCHFGTDHRRKREGGFLLPPLLQLRVLRFGLLQDGDVKVGVFPEGDEIFVGGQCPDAGGIGICTL
jgi:hypothetical protein